MQNKSLSRNERAARKAVALPADHAEIMVARIGVLLVNLGTPDGTSYWPMWRYLREFLSDKRVIERPRIAWYPILYGVILNTRPKKSGAAYDAIWNRKEDESPLRTFTRSQGEKLAADLGRQDNVIVDWAMRYGQPPIAERLEHLRAKGCERILIFPLYPQYAAATTATVNDKAFETLQAMRWQPAIRTVPPYFDEPVYIEALAQSIEAHLATLDFEPEIVLASYHGLPQSYCDKGDPYFCHCQKTSRLLLERLGWPSARLMTAFQSRFGPEKWLQPYTDKTVEALAKEGVKRLAIVNPGFACDCLETLEEIAIGVGEMFRDSGGKHFAHIPCLNDSQAGMAVIKAIVLRELQGWI